MWVIQYRIEPSAPCPAPRDHGADMPVRLLRPSRPGEFHPQPLTDPDLTLSRDPACATARRLQPSVENWVASWHVGDLPPSLHGHYPASTLLRGSPPLSGASVLSASRLEPLVPFPLASLARFSRSVQEPG